MKVSRFKELVADTPEDLKAGELILVSIDGEIWYRCRFSSMNVDFETGGLEIWGIIVENDEDTTGYSSKFFLGGQKIKCWHFARRKQ